MQRMRRRMLPRMHCLRQPSVAGAQARGMVPGNGPAVACCSACGADGGVAKQPNSKGLTPGRGPGGAGVHALCQ